MISQIFRLPAEGTVLMKSSWVNIPQDSKVLYCTREGKQRCQWLATNPEESSESAARSNTGELCQQKGRYGCVRHVSCRVFTELLNSPNGASHICHYCDKYLIETKGRKFILVCNQFSVQVHLIHCFGLEVQQNVMVSTCLGRRVKQGGHLFVFNLFIYQM